METRARYRLILLLDIAMKQTVGILDSIEDEIMMNRPYKVPLKLLCMYSIINGGLKQGVYDQFKKDFIHVYSFY